MTLAPSIDRVNVAFMNESTFLSDATVQQILPALHTQVSRDFYPTWGISANLLFVPRGEKPPPGYWWLTMFDTSDQAGALGYHDVTDEYLPLGKVFSKTSHDAGDNWTITTSHELLEMLGDPAVNLVVFSDDTTLMSYEACDAPESDEFGYQIDGVTVSDFVLPAWFEAFRKPGSTKFDFQGHISKPFEILAGGYMGVFDIAHPSRGWGQIYGKLKPGMRAEPRNGHRMTLRPKSPDNYIESKPKWTQS